jgi:hypothetical protein
MVMQAANFRELHDLSKSRWLHRSRLWANRPLSSARGVRQPRVPIVSSHSRRWSASLPSAGFYPATVAGQSRALSRRSQTVLMTSTRALRLSFAPTSVHSENSVLVRMAISLTAAL